MFRSLFPLLMLLLMSAIHGLAYRRILRRLHLGKRARTLLALGLGANYLGTLLYIGGRYLFDLPGGLYFFASLSVAVAFLLLFAILLYEILHILQTRLPLHPQRRRLLKRSTDLLFVGAGALYLGIGLFNGETRPTVTRVRVDQGVLQRPVRIAQISDLHIGGLVDRDFVRRIVEIINREQVDLVAITGDLIDTSVGKNLPAIEELFRLRSRWGTFYVPGNHEYFHGIEEILAYLKASPIHVLDNRSRKLGAFYVVGLTDRMGTRMGRYPPDPEGAFADVPAGAPVLLLMHQPRMLSLLGDRKPRPSLILAGHTHGGQIWPFGYLVKRIQPYLQGLHLLGPRSAIYVNRGVGYWGPPMRIGAPAEITILEWR